MVRQRIRIAMGDSARAVQRAASPDLAAGLDAANDLLLRVATVYPPPLAGSTYVRTNRLRDGWEPIGPFATNRQGTAGIVNGVEYADYVMGDRQAAVHAGRWQTAEQIARDQEGPITDLVEAALLTQIGGV